MATLLPLLMMDEALLKVLMLTALSHQLVVWFDIRLDVVPPSVVIVALQYWLRELLRDNVVLVILILLEKAQWLSDLFDVLLAD